MAKAIKKTCETCKHRAPGQCSITKQSLVYCKRWRNRKKTTGYIMKFFYHKACEKYEARNGS